MISVRPRALSWSHTPVDATTRATSRTMARAVVLRSDHVGSVSTRHATGTSNTATPSANSVATKPRSPRTRRGRRGVTAACSFVAEPDEAERPVGHDAGDPPVEHDDDARGHPPLLVVALDLHVTPELAAEQVAHDVARPLLALRGTGVDRCARPRTLVDRGSDDTTGVEVDDEVRQRDEHEQRERGRGHELHGRQTRS